MQTYRKERIREFRIERGWTLEQLAKAVGPEYQRQNAYVWETRADGIGANLLGKIADALGVTVSMLYEISSSKQKRRCASQKNFG
jgi:transcriptional regulator with XRE-family HTH domain